MLPKWRMAETMRMRRAAEISSSPNPMIFMDLIVLRNSRLSSTPDSGLYPQLKNRYKSLSSRIG